MIKVVAANMVMDVLDRAIQVHGSHGMSDDLPLAQMWRYSRMLRKRWTTVALVLALAYALAQMTWLLVPGLPPEARIAPPAPAVPVGPASTERIDAPRRACTIV